MTKVEAQAEMDSGLPPFVPFPAAPWVARGGCWVGVFRAATPATLPPQFRPLLDAGWRVVALVRYEAGSTLTYDELLVGSLVRHSVRFGLYVEHIYVNSVPSLWGGRAIWGLPKRLATFSWETERCRVTDEAGPIATLQVDTRSARLPIPLPLVAPAFGLLEARPAQLVAPLLARLGRSGMRVEEWSPRFGYSLPARPFLSVAAKPFRVRFPAPVIAR